MGEKPAAALVLEPVRRMLRAEHAAAYAPRREGTRIVLDYHHDDLGVGLARFERTINEWDQQSWLTYDPGARQPVEWRNRAMNLRQLERSAASSVKTTLLSLHRFREVWNNRGVDHLRTLLCEDGEVVGVLGLFREEPFGQREAALLNGITPALLRRLRLERDLAWTALARSALDVLLEAFSGVAFLLQGTAIACVNAAGKRLLDADPAGTRNVIAEAIRGRRPGWETHSLRLTGAPPSWIVLARSAAGAREVLLARAAIRYGLSPREAQVLSVLSEGLGNPAIARRLRISIKTVEHHVTALLSKMEAETRAALISRLIDLTL
jgi:DNA-binding CsgD family transcriptional regulator